jgi:NitT/TauT family transport system substrate-binding protein
MMISKLVLKIGGVLSFAVAIFQAVITFSPSWSLYFGAPEKLVSNRPMLHVAGLTVAVIFVVFGLYGMSGAGSIRPLPLLRLVLLLFWLVIAPGALAQETALKKVTFLPQWIPQAQFAGYYVAYEKGFYKERGLEVEILTGGPDRPASEILAARKVDFATLFLADGIAQRAQGLELVNIGQIVQKSAFMLVAKKSSGIHKPEDLNDKKVGLWGAEFQLLPRAFFRQYHLTVHIVPQTTTMNLFLRGGVEAASAMWYNEYYQLINAGLEPEELTTFLLSDYVMKFPEDGIYCLQETWTQDPRRCADFVMGSIAGWRYALAHPTEALDIVMKYVKAANVATNRVHQRWMLERMKDIIEFDGAPALGSLSAAAYGEVAQELKKSGFIEIIPDYDVFYKGPRN